jgi:5,10-methenyltetrahydrofolate synthetase
MNSRSLALPFAADEVPAWRKSERARLIARREALPLEERRTADAHITELLVLGFPLLGSLTIGFYWPFKGEVDPRLAMRRFRARGARGALPEVVKKGAPLQFREWTPGCVTRPGVFGLPIPVDGAVVVPDVVMVPPVGFGTRGYRLGYGGGYFDRTLAALSPRPLAIGLAREVSRIDTIYPQPHDVRMDFIVTENGIHHATATGMRRVAELEEAGRIAETIHATRGHAMSTHELAAFLNTLLEAERAGAKLLAAFLEQMTLAPDARDALARIQHDESRNCVELMDLLRHIGAEKSAATSDFLDRALAVAGKRQRLEFLNRGQAWVARRIATALPRIRDTRIRAAMLNMQASHVANIRACEALTPGTP